MDVEGPVSQWMSARVRASERVQRSLARMIDDVMITNAWIGRDTLYEYPAFLLSRRITSGG
jgi:hypothetical protein